LQNTEAADADPLTLFEMLDNISDKAAKDDFGLPFRKLIFFRNICSKVFQSDSRCNFCGHSSCTV